MTDNTVRSNRGDSSLRYLKLTAFTSGMAIMAVEMSASRLMAPYFGSSIFIWTNLIGIIMASLALGYWVGGRWIDSAPKPTRLYILVLLSALFLYGLPWIAPPVMAVASGGVRAGEVSLVINSFLSALVIFGVPFILLGMISPSIIRLLSESVENSGKIAGRVYALSTLGSILGTFLPTLLFIPWIGTKRTILLFASMLLVVGILGLGKRRYSILLLGAVLGMERISPYYASEEGLVVEAESGYTYLKVLKDDYYGLILQQDEGYAIHSYYHPTLVSTGGYWDFMPLFPYLQADKHQQRVTVIGAAGGTVFHILERTKQAGYAFSYDGAEIDPAVIALARQYFELDSLNADIKAQDGRIFIAQHQDDIDILVLDAYHQLYIPPHLTSLEFFQLAKSKLSANGSVVININSLFETSDIYERIVRTMQEVFGYVSVLSVGQGRYNYLIIGSNGNVDFINAIHAAPDSLAALKSRALSQTRYVNVDNGAKLITDDRPLSEVLFDKMVGEWLLSKAR